MQPYLQPLRYVYNVAAAAATTTTILLLMLLSAGVGALPFECN